MRPIDAGRAIAVYRAKQRGRVQGRNLIALRDRVATLVADLHAARLRFKLAVPTSLNLYQFTANTSQQTQKSTDGVQVTAERIEKDIAQVSIQGGGDFWLFAYDQTGQSLSAKESMGSANSKFVRFSGVIDKLQVVMALKMLNHTFDIHAALQ